MDYRFELPLMADIEAAGFKVTPLSGVPPVPPVEVIEQYLRDCKILTIWEGTSFIHANDFNGLKVFPFHSPLNFCFALPITSGKAGNKAPDWIHPGLFSLDHDPVRPLRQTPAGRHESNGGPS